MTVLLLSYSMTVLLPGDLGSSTVYYATYGQLRIYLQLFPYHSRITQPYHFSGNQISSLPSGLFKNNHKLESV